MCGRLLEIRLSKDFKEEVMFEMSQRRNNISSVSKIGENILGGNCLQNSTELWQCQGCLAD